VARSLLQTRYELQDCGYAGIVESARKATVGAGFIPARLLNPGTTGGDKPRPYRPSCYYFLLFWKFRDSFSLPVTPK